MERAIAHLNIVGFRAAVAALEDKRLLGRPYAIAGGKGGRAVVWDVSRAALDGGVKPGMALAAAERLVRDLAVLPPNPAACQKVNGVLETVIARYAPVWQNDGGGNLYLDITGTKKLFGPPADCTWRVSEEIKDTIGLEMAAAAAINKLTCKVASRVIRPVGFLDIHPGDEAAFLANKKLALLPGMGPLLTRTAAVAGFREIGEIAALGRGEAVSLFGKKGLLLRDSALGIDDSPVEGGAGKRQIKRRADFPEDVIDEEIIRGALASLVEDGGLQMRRDKLGARMVCLALVYSDGVALSGRERSKRLLVLEKDILAAAERVYRKSAERRVRISSIRISLEDLAPLGYEADLFSFEDEAKEWRLQRAVDLIHDRYGNRAVMRGIVFRGCHIGC
jgi:DNA polymerase IV